MIDRKHPQPPCGQRVTPLGHRRPQQRSHPLGTVIVSVTPISRTLTSGGDLVLASAAAWPAAPTERSAVMRVAATAENTAGHNPQPKGPRGAGYETYSAVSDRADRSATLPVIGGLAAADL